MSGFEEKNEEAISVFWARIKGYYFKTRIRAMEMEKSQPILRYEEVVMCRQKQIRDMWPKDSGRNAADLVPGDLPDADSCFLGSPTTPFSFLSSLCSPNTSVTFRGLCSTQEPLSISICLPNLPICPC